MEQQETPSSEFSSAALGHLDALYGYAMALTRNPAMAEDLVQETYLRAVRAFGRLVPDSNLKGWMFAIMRNAWLNQLRHDRLGPRFVELDVEETDRVRWLDERNDPFGDFERKETREQVREAIESLPQPYQEIIVLRDIEGFSYQQIAAVLGCPAGTVMSRLCRARDRLRVQLAGLRMGRAT
jgi:RNA polymerase sigma-70 factor (ECF subfamily)